MISFNLHGIPSSNSDLATLGPPRENFQNRSTIDRESGEPPPFLKSVVHE